MSLLNPTATELFDLARAGQPRPAINLVLALLATGTTTEELIIEVLAPIQREVGRRWEANEWNVADEHAATAVIDGALGALGLHTPAPEAPVASVLLACAEGEYHTIPARMGAELLRGHGYEVTFLGGSLPAHDLQRYAGVTQPDLAVISCTIPHFLPGTRRSFAAIDEVGLPGVAAGAAFGNDDRRARRLGASGWLGPKADLTDVQACLQVRAPLATSAPPEALALELAADDLQQSCMATLTERMPRLATFSEAQLASTRADINHILAYLTTSIDIGDDTIYRVFITWLANVLDRRGLPPTVLSQSLDIIGEVLAAAGMTEASRLCATTPATPNPH